MPKAQTKSRTDLTLSEPDPRVRMKEIRKIVSKALKNNKRIDLMNFNERDRNRVIVALQDEVMHSRERHTRATKHVAQAKLFFDFMLPASEALIDNLINDLSDRNQQLEFMEQMILKERHAHNHTAERLEEAQNDACDLGARLEIMKAAVGEFTQ